MTADTEPTIAVLGAGSWGTALALLLARHGRTTLLWGHNSVHMARVQHERVNAEQSCVKIKQ